MAALLKPFSNSTNGIISVNAIRQVRPPAGLTDLAADLPVSQQNIPYGRVPTQLDTQISEFYNTYKTQLFNNLDKQIKQETIYGESCYQFVTQQLYFAFYLAWIIKADYDLKTNPDWNDYIEDYDLECLSDGFACNGINIDNVFKIFDLPPVKDQSSIVTPNATIVCLENEDEGGIESVDMGIEDFYEVEPQATLPIECVTETETLVNLLNAETQCVYSIEQC